MRPCLWDLPFQVLGMDSLWGLQRNNRRKPQSESKALCKFHLWCIISGPCAAWAPALSSALMKLAACPSRSPGIAALPLPTIADNLFHPQASSSPLPPCSNISRQTHVAQGVKRESVEDQVGLLRKSVLPRRGGSKRIPVQSSPGQPPQRDRLGRLLSLELLALSSTS